MSNGTVEQDVSKFVDPSEILGQLELEEGDTVADFGCGPGFFTLLAAQEVGVDGKVFAFDIMPQVLETVSSQARMKGITNISTKRVNLEKEGSTELDNDSVDLVIMKNILFQNKDKQAILNEAHRILKNNGQVLIMEWNEEKTLVGPQEGVRINPEDLSRMLIATGFVLKNKLDAGDFHYVIIASK